jgi:hypothetical protein
LEKGVDIFEIHEMTETQNLIAGFVVPEGERANALRNFRQPCAEYFMLQPATVELVVAYLSGGTN